MASNPNPFWLSRGWGLLLLGVWAFLSGLAAIFHLTFELEGVVLGVLLLVAGVLIILGR